MDGVGVRLGVLAVVGLNEHVLAQQQALAVIQRDIEGVFAGLGGIVTAAIVVVVALGGVVPIHLVDSAVPHRIADAAAQQHVHAHLQRGGVVLIDVSLHPVAAGLHNGHKGLGVTHLVVGAILIDGLHHAGYGGIDGDVLQSRRQTVNLHILGGDIVLLLHDVGVGLPNHELIGLQLFAVQSTGSLLVLGLLLLLVGQRVFHPLQIQPCPLQVHAGLGGVVGEQGLALCHLIAYADLHGGHLAVAVGLDLRLALGGHHAGKPLGQAHRAHAADHADALHRRLAVCIGAAARQQTQAQGQHQEKCCFFHVALPLFSFCVSLPC